MTDLKTAFSAFRKDPRWLRKLGLAVLVDLIPYVGPIALYGWMIEYERHVAWGMDERLPEWKGFWGYTLKGLLAYLVVLPYSMVLSVLIMPVTYAFSIGGTGYLIRETGSMGPETAIVLGLAIGVAMMALIWPFTLLIIPIIEGSIARFAVYGRIEAGFQLGEVWRSIKVNGRVMRGAWLWSAVLTTAATGFAYLVFALPWLPMVLAVLQGTDPSPASFLVAAVSMPVAFVAVLPVTMYVGLACRHIWGRYAAAAHALPGASPAPQ